MEKSKKIKKTIINLMIFIFLIILTFWIILKDQDISQILHAVRSVKKEYILMGICAMIVYISCETINIERILKALGEKSTFIRNFKYTLIGFFFSAITPAASGGQPMEIYYMHKEKISVANSTLALLMHLTSLQVVTITIGIISVIPNFSVVKDGLIWLFLLGIFLNSSALALLIISIFSKGLSKALINFVVKILKFFKIKNVEQKQEKLEKELETYQESAMYIKSHKLLMLKTVLTTLIQMIAYYCVPYCIYKAYGLNTYNILQMISLQAVLYATVSGIPSPGAVGVSEGGFLGIFANVFPNMLINSAMLLNRVVNFYLLVLISGIVVIVNMFKTKDIVVENTEIGQNNNEIQ